MDTKKITEQVGALSWVGAVQVQTSNSMFYVNLINTGMMILTFWYTAGYQIKDRYMPWLSIWHFIGAVIFAVVVVMYLDYRFVYPSRQAFINEQACKHPNPAMDELKAIRAELVELRKELGLAK